jgi:2-hydroxychromene-2-carboxylate isomerase
VAAGRPTVEFFYCCSCPWSYLAHARLRETATRTGAAISYRPVLAALLDDVAERLPARWLTSANAAVSAYARKDLQDWAQFCGVLIRRSDRLPRRPEWAQRGAVLAVATGVGARYAEAVFSACFTQGRDIESREVVIDIAAGCGLAGPAFEAGLAAEETLDVIRRNVGELVSRGGFGSPTLFLGEDMYFGHDRVPLLEGALMRSHDRRFIAPGEHGR